MFSQFINKNAAAHNIELNQEEPKRSQLKVCKAVLGNMRKSLKKEIHQINKEQIDAFINDITSVSNEIDELDFIYGLEKLQEENLIASVQGLTESLNLCHKNLAFAFVYHIDVGQATRKEIKTFQDPLFECLGNLADATRVILPSNFSFIKSIFK